MIGKWLDFIRSYFQEDKKTPVEPIREQFSYDTDLIKKWEGLRLKAYKDTGGVWTIGYGHTATARPGMVITLQEAEYLLAKDVKWAVQGVKDLFVVPLTHGQRSALVSFVYNLGVSQVAGSTLRRKLNAGDYQGASKEFLRWVYDNGQFIQGLKNRRKDEVRKFWS